MAFISEFRGKNKKDEYDERNSRRISLEDHNRTSKTRVANGTEKNN